MMDIGIYALNAARYLTGEEPTEVNAMIDDDAERSALRGSGGEHHLPAALPERRARQLHVELRRAASTASASSAPSGWARARAGAELRRPAHARRPWTTDRGSLAAAASTTSPREMDHFSDCVTNNKEPLTPGEEGLKDMRIIEAVYGCRGTRAGEAGVGAGTSRLRQAWADCATRSRCDATDRWRRPGCLPEQRLGVRPRTRDRNQQCARLRAAVRRRPVR